MPNVEIRTKTYGTGKSAHQGAQVLIDGNDISNDVLSVDVHLDGQGGNRTVVELIPAAVDVKGVSVELSDATVAGLKLMGWANMGTAFAAMLKAATLCDTALKARIAALGDSPDGRVDVAELEGLFDASMDDAIAEAKKSGLLP